MLQSQQNTDIWTIINERSSDFCGDRLGVNQGKKFYEFTLLIFYLA